MSSPSKRPQRGRNFYGPGPYIEREVDVGLLEALHAGEYTLVLSARGSGKSSLRIRASEQLTASGTRVATVDLGGIGAETRADAFCGSVVIEAARSLGLAEQAKKAWRRSKGPPQTRLRACLREVLLEPHDAPLVLFIDELELVRSLGPARDDFFAALRAMSDARGEDGVWRRLSVCLIGALTRDELISDPGRSSFDLPAREFNPRDFSREQLDEFGPTLAPLGVDQKALLDALYDWTSGNPALVQWICGDLLLREFSRGSEASAVEAVIRESFLQRGPEVDPLLGDTARRLRRDHRDPYRTRMLAAYERVLRGEIVDLRGRQLGSEGALVVARLKVAGLVAPSAGGKLRVRNRVVERAFDRNWVRRALAGRPVSDALERWETGGRRSGLLLRGEGLRAAIEWVEGRPDVTPSERDFVLASESARALWLRRLLYAGSALCLGLGATLGVVVWQYRVAVSAPVVSPDAAAPGGTGTQPDQGSASNDPSGGSADVAGVAADPQGPNFVATARHAVEQAAGTDEQSLKINTLETELSALELRLAIERAARAELLAPEPTRRSEGLELALAALSAWSEAGSDIADVPAPITRGLTANLASPGDTMLISAHAGPVEWLQFTADGARLASVNTNEIHVWERDTGRRVASLTSIAGTIDALALSPSGRRLAALSEEGSLTVWNLSEGAALGPAPITAPFGVPMPLAPVASLAVDDGGNVSVIRRDGSIDTVDPKAGNASARLQASALARTLALEQAVVINPSLGAETRVGVVHGESIELWDVASGQVQASVSVPQLRDGGRARSLLATPDAGELLIAFEGDPAITVWNTARGTLRSIAELTSAAADAPSAGPANQQVGPSDLSSPALALSPEGELIATGGEDRIARVWSIETGELLTSTQAHEAPLTSLAFTPDSAALVVGDRSGQLRVHPLTLNSTASLPLRGATLNTAGVAATVHYDETALELRWSGGQTSVRWAQPRPLTRAGVSVDGSRLALLYADGELALISGAAGPDAKPIATVTGADGSRVLDFALSIDGKLLAAATEDRKVLLLAGDGQPIATLSGHEAPVDRLALSPDGARLVSADRSNIVRAWDPGTAAILGTFETERRAEHLAINGDFFLIIDQLGGAELWSTQTRERLATLELGTEPITGVAIADDGEWFALGRSGGTASAVELWRPSSPEALARFRGFGPVAALRFIDEGETVLAVDGRGQLARWPARPRAWLAEGCATLAPGSVVPSVCAEPSDPDL
ncbi:AAA-like domain-containing protein [Enhygromyxa salina]|uniref:WD domain, G-beta repeat n=1 Tax=Enhygromyxa salina TaxID=215803 RepID=A0A2S9Y7Z0_9BACT|nr:AAA-like domain-containing protein [Enhygromyxa salina]PRQ01217.1 WD domain, G-beta repeat [Enhygromyxa salina]